MTGIKLNSNSNHAQIYKLYEPGRGAENSELYVAHALSKISNFFVLLLREP